MLAEIFYIYILIIRQARTRTKNPPRPYAWLVIRHVCRAWRTVALDFPKLSTHIYVSSLDCIQDMLDHSGTMPLFVYDTCDSWWRYGIESQRRVFTQLDRILSAEIYSHNGTQDTVPQVSHSPAVSIVRSLLIHFGPYYDRTSPLFTNYIFPDLRELACHSCNLQSFYKLVPTSLRRFSICHGYPTILLDDLVAFLHNLPQLEELVVHQGFDISDVPEDRHRFLPPRQTAVLLHLTWLEVRDLSYMAGLHLLRRLVYPGLARVKLDFVRIFEQPPYDFPADVLFSRFHASDDTQPQSLSIISSRHECIRVCLWTERQSLEELRSGTHPPCFSFCLTNALAGSLTGIFLCQLPLSHVETAYLAEPVANGELPWRDLFPLLSSTEEVSLSYEIWGGMDVAIWNSAANFERVVPRSLLPSLKIAKLYALYHPIQHFTPNVDCISDLHVLAYFLRAQCQWGRKAGSVFAEGEPITVWSISLNFHQDGSPCLDDDRPAAYLDEHPEVVSNLPSREPEGSCVTPVTSWLSARGTNLRWSLRMGT